MTTARGSIGPMRRTQSLLIVVIGAILLASWSIVSAHEDDNGDKSARRAGGRSGSVWVVNRDRGELTVFDSRTGAVLATRLVGKGAHDICISERARKAYITAEADNMVAVVDTRTLDIDWIPVSPLPHHIEPSPDGRLIYVSLDSHPTAPTAAGAHVAVIDTKDNSVRYMTTSDNLLARSHGPRPSLDGKTLYVAHDTGNEVTAVDLETGNIDLTVKSIPRAEEVIPTRFGRYLWVSARGDGTVKRIDIDGMTVTDSVAVGVQPESVMLTPFERTLIVSLRGSPAMLGFVNTVALEAERPVQIGGDGTFGDLAVITRNGRFVYATFDAGAGGTGGVAVVDVRRRKVVATWEYPGTGRPHGIWYSKRKPHL